MLVGSFHSPFFRSFERFTHNKREEKKRLEKLSKKKWKEKIKKKRRKGQLKRKKNKDNPKKKKKGCRRGHERRKEKT